MIKFYIYSRALGGTETWALCNISEKYPESLKCGAGEGWRVSVTVNV